VKILIKKIRILEHHYFILVVIENKALVKYLVEHGKDINKENKL